MTPSSGARSGMQPSRSERGAGDGAVGPITLACGHGTHLAPALSNPDRWWCNLCAEFVGKKGAR